MSPREGATQGSREDGRDKAGKVAPVVDRNRCEGKEDCVVVCPYDVLEMGVLTKDERRVLSMLGRVKAWAHGNRQACVVKPQDCHACNLCVEACPENALSLSAAAQTST